jgi:hypothetical protein
MAHFAKLDEDNIVIKINVLNNDVLDPQNEEFSGILFLTEWSGGHSNWKQTSYNGSFRKNYANVGDIYDSERDAFYNPQPYTSWILDESTCRWVPPVEKPEDDGVPYVWDEESQKWSPRIVPPLN